MTARRFGRWLAGGVIWCAMSMPAGAATVTLAWDPNPEPDVTNYNVYVRTGAGSFGLPIPVGNRTTWTFVGLQSNVKYYFAVQAESPAGLSPLSQISYVIPATNLPGSEASRSDFNGDGTFDVLWQNMRTGQLLAWHLNGAQVVSGRWLSPSAVAKGWVMSGAGDVSKDGKPDVLWHNQQTGQVVFWLMDGVLSYAGGVLPGPVAATWRIASVNDFNADGNPDIWWHNQQTGEMIVWYFNGTTYRSSAYPGRVADTNWKIKGTADFTGDGRPDLMWHNEATGELRLWQLNGITPVSTPTVNPKFVAPNWRIGAIGDAGHDGRAYIVWQNSVTGELILWTMQGTTRVGGAFLSIPVAALEWKIVGPR